MSKLHSLSHLPLKFFSLVLLLSMHYGCAESFGTAQHEEGEDLPALVSEAIKALVFIKSSGEAKEYYSDEELLEYYYAYSGDELDYKSSKTGGANGCSGFIIDLAKGYIVTNYHCVDVDELDYLKLKLENGKIYDGKIVGRDPLSDVAVVAVTDTNFDRDGLAQLRFGDSDALQLGEEVFVLGAPKGFERSVARGVISGLDRALFIISIGKQIQTDVRTFSGNSGSPLLNLAGEVVGLHTWGSRVRNSDGDIYGSISFQNSANTVQHVVQNIIATGAHAWGHIAVEWQKLRHEWQHTEIRNYMQLDTYPELADGSGVLIRSVQRDTSAAKSGLLPGDVVFAIGDQRVADEREAINAIAFAKPGTELAIYLLRNGKKEIVRVEVEQRQTAAQRQPLAATDRVWGVKVAEIRKDSTFYHRTGQDGLLVLKTSSHLYLDLHLGDFIVTMDGIAVNSVEQFRQYLEKREEVLLHVERKAGNYLYVLLKKAKKNKNERVE